MSCEPIGEGSFICRRGAEPRQAAAEASQRKAAWNPQRHLYCPWRPDTGYCKLCGKKAEEHTTRLMQP